MAAQESSKVCPKCFEVNDHGATFCIECGAPFSDDPVGEGSDQEVYREITQANLHRIRGDYKDAVNTCLAILKRFPNNGTAHTLLGDIHAEQGELEQSAQWFEMALDLRPESENDRRKLDAVQKRVSEQEAASTAQQLGIPDSQPRTQQYVFVMAILIAIVGVAGFLVGNSMGDNSGNAAPVVINDPIDVAPVDPVPDPPKDPVDIEPVWIGNASDVQIMSALNQNAAMGARVLIVQSDFRVQKLNVTALLGPEENPFDVTTLIAQTIYTDMPGYASITVNLTDGQTTVFMADVLHDDYVAAIENGEDYSQMISAVWPLNLED